jgi:hypothetical protein
MLSEKDHHQIIAIIKRIPDHINYATFINWLDQFEKEDRPKAIEVASKIRYYSDSQILEIYENNQEKIQNLAKEYQEKITKWVNSPTTPGNQRLKFKKKHYKKKVEKGFNDVIAFPIGEVGKSGVAMSYKYTHTSSYRKSKLFRLDNIDKPIKIKENGVVEFWSGNRIRHKELTVDVVLIDDIIGSGGTVIKFLESKIIPFFQEIEVFKVRVHICAIVVLNQADKALKEFVSKSDYVKSFRTYGEKLDRCFSSKSSVFGYRPRMIPIREFCYKYGEKLFIQSKYNNGNREEIRHPLGYENSQALVAFSHATPNNTLPIIWSSFNNWRPLIARKPIARIDRLKNLRKDMYLWLSIAKNLGLEQIIDKKGEVYSTENVRLLCYMRLKKEGNKTENIRLKLNLAIPDFDELLANGTSRNILLDTGEISEYGLQMYNDITSRIKRKNRYEYIDPDEILYLPSSFRGKA